MSSVSAARYAWMLRYGGKGEIGLSLRHPFQADIKLRQQGSDRYTLKEIVVEEVYRPVTQHVPKDIGHVIDLGANIGLASLYLLNHFPSARVFAVEANPVTFQVLQSNLQRFCASGRAGLLNAAAWHSQVELAGFNDRSDDHYSRFQVASTTDADNAAIAGLPMKNIIDKSGFPDVDLLKVDIEGAETAIFARDVEWLDRVRCIAIEFHGDSRLDSKFDKHMLGHGFNIIEYDGHTVLATR